MITTRIDHLAFRVSDIDKISGLLKQLGYVEVRRTAHHGGALEMENPEQPGLVLEFTTLDKKKDSDEMEEPGFDHAGFNLTQEQLNELVAAGFPTAGNPRLNPESGRLLESFKDSDGIKWQFTVN